MTEREKTVSSANNWADEIDDLNREAMMRYLETIYSTRRPFIKIEAADDPLSGGSRVRAELRRAASRGNLRATPVNSSAQHGLASGGSPLMAVEMA